MDDSWSLNYWKENIIFFIFFVALIIGIAFYLYHDHQVNITNQRKVDQVNIAEQHKADIEDMKAKQMAGDNEKYAQSLTLTCDKKVVDLTGIDLYRCYNIFDDQYSYTEGVVTPDMKQNFTNPNIPSYCNSKIKDLSANEFIRCLDDPMNMLLNSRTFN